METLTLGALCFGLVIGWVTYRTLRRSQTTNISDLAAVLGAVGGATVTRISETGSDAFAYYCIGLALGFFGYFIVALLVPTGHSVQDWMMDPR